MKIINKSDKEEAVPEDTFFVILEKDSGDCWEGADFCCASSHKYPTEEAAIEDAWEYTVVAKVTLVAKIV